MNDHYTKLGFGAGMRKTDSFAGRPREYQSALVNDLKQEPTPYLHQTAISKGTVSTTGGGVTEIRDVTGGTVLFTVDPTTGVVTIAGPITAQVTLNVGTINDTAITGQATLAGTLTNNRLIQNGTWTNGTFITSNIQNPTIGTPALAGGTVGGGVVNAIIGTINNMIVGTPTITGGSFVSGTFTNPVIDGTPNLDVNAGSPPLSAAGDFAVQTSGGSAQLAVRVGADTYFFTPDGTQ